MEEGTEMQTMLPSNGSKNGVIVPKQNLSTNDSQEVENGLMKSNDGKFNPFVEREVANPTTDGETLTHLLKACLGSGILSMPFAFKYTGLLGGIIGTIIVAFICTHCSYILLKCAHVLYFRTRKTTMSFAEVAEAALESGPQWGKKFSKFSGYFIKICLFVTYFGAVSVYSVLIAKNFKQVLDFYLEAIETKTLIACLLIPLILLCWIPNLKYLAPFSTLANVLMGTSLAITVYYLVINLEHSNETISFSTSIDDYPNFFSLTVFAIEAIGVMMPLENNMKTPQNFVGIFGVLNKGMFGCTVIYIIIGYLGYSAYGKYTAETITLNLPGDEYAAQAVKVFISLAVFFTFALQFYVCMDIAWNAIKDYCKAKPVLSNYILRTVLVTLSVLLAWSVPTIAPFMGLIGAFCFSILGILVPVFIETITYWDSGFGRYNWMIVKNVVISILGLVALIAGSLSALSDIKKELSGSSEPNNSTIIANLINATIQSINSTTTEAITTII